MERGGVEKTSTTTGRGQPAETETTAEGSNRPILIKTHVTFLKVPNSKVGAIAEVLPGSKVGDSAFCVEGRFSDRRGQQPPGSVVKTFRCPGGSLTITFSPKPGLETSSDWKVVTGSGRFEGLSGGGRVKAAFESSGEEGRETFTGTVTR